MALHLLKGPFSVADYHRMAECGILHEDDRVELLDGQVVPMTPIGGRHIGCVIRLTRLIGPRLGEIASLSVQNPLVLDDRYEPQPDIVVLRGKPQTGSWLPNHAEALLVIEVADTSLDHDRDIKIPAFARAGIPEAWLVDLVGEGIWIHRDPAGDVYESVRLAARGETITPLLLPQISLGVDEILG